jgi:hypothetical protein
MKMKGLTESGTKFAKRASAAGPEYKTGVLNPKAPWQESTLNAEDNYNTGVTEAISRGAFGKGVSKTSNSDWQGKASTKGFRNYSTAVGESGSDWAKGYAPIHSALSALTLTPRGPRNSPGNYDRSRQVGEAAAKARTG